MKWKIKSLNLFTIVALIGMMSCLSSCVTQEDHEIKNPEDLYDVYTEVEFTAVFTSDLLNFMVPIITIVTDNVDTTTYRLTKEDFKEIENVNESNITSYFSDAKSSDLIAKASLCKVSLKKRIEDVKSHIFKIEVEYLNKDNKDNKDKHILDYLYELSMTNNIKGFEYNEKRCVHSTNLKLLETEYADLIVAAIKTPFNLSLETSDLEIEE